MTIFPIAAGLDNLCDLLRIVIARGGGAAGWDSNPGTGPTAAAPSLGPTASSQRRSSPMSCGGDDSVGGGGVLQHWTVARVAVASAANHLELAASSKVGHGGARGLRYGKMDFHCLITASAVVGEVCTLPCGGCFRGGVCGTPRWARGSAAECRRMLTS